MLNNIIFQREKDSYHDYGCSALVIRASGKRWPYFHFNITVSGISRFKIQDVIQTYPFPIASVTHITDSIQTQDKSKL